MVAHAAGEGAVTAGLTTIATFLLSCSKFEALALLITLHIFYDNITNSTHHMILSVHMIQIKMQCFCYDVSKLNMCDRVMLILNCVFTG